MCASMPGWRIETERLRGLSGRDRTPMTPCQYSICRCLDAPADTRPVSRKTETTMATDAAAGFEGRRCDGWCPEGAIVRQCTVEPSAPSDAPTIAPSHPRTLEPLASTPST